MLELYLHSPILLGVLVLNKLRNNFTFTFIISENRVEEQNGKLRKNPSLPILVLQYSNDACNLNL
jgi:hypothetical protein